MCSDSEAPSRIRKGLLEVLILHLHSPSKFELPPNLSLSSCFVELQSLTFFPSLQVALLAVPQCPAPLALRAASGPGAQLEVQRRSPHSTKDTDLHVQCTYKLIYHIF